MPCDPSSSLSPLRLDPRIHVPRLTSAISSPSSTFDPYFEPHPSSTLPCSCPTMSLSKHVDPEELIEQAADHPILGLFDHPAGKRAHAYHRGAHAGRYNTEPIPKYKIPEKGTDPDATYQVSLRLLLLVHPAQSCRADTTFPSGIFCHCLSCSTRTSASTASPRSTSPRSSTPGCPNKPPSS